VLLELGVAVVIHVVLLSQDSRVGGESITRPSVPALPRGSSDLRDGRAVAWSADDALRNNWEFSEKRERETFGTRPPGAAMDVKEQRGEC
jgi:hypothetical protein